MASGGVRSVLRLVAGIVGLIEEARREVIEALAGALGARGYADDLASMIYEFSSPEQPSIRELEEMIAKSMGFEGVEDVISYLKSIGSNSARSS